MNKLKNQKIKRRSFNGEMNSDIINANHGPHSPQPPPENSGFFGMLTAGVNAVTEAVQDIVRLI